MLDRLNTSVSSIFHNIAHVFRTTHKYYTDFLMSKMIHRKHSLGIENKEIRKISSECLI